MGKIERDYPHLLEDPEHSPDNSWIRLRRTVKLGTRLS